MKLHRLRSLKATLLAMAVASGLFQYTMANAALLDLSKIPLFIGGGVTPNVFFMLDNSGSMDWEILTRIHWDARSYDRYTLATGGAQENSSNDNQTKMTDGQWYGVGRDANGGTRGTYYYLFSNPDNQYGTACRNGGYANATGACTKITDDWRLYSAALNVLYYNPGITYKPWRGKPDAVFTAARSHPNQNHISRKNDKNVTIDSDTGYNSQRDLTGFVYYVWDDDKGFNGAQPRRGINILASVNNNPNGIVDLWDSRTRYTVNANSITVEQITCNPLATGDLNCAVQNTSTINNAAQVSAAQQNIANWYQYARRRYLLTTGAVDKVNEAKPNFRYGMNQINRSNELFIEMPAAGVQNFINHNNNMIDNLFNKYYAKDGTPLRSSLKRAGEYYRNALQGKANPIIYTCQQNFTILMSDGYWNTDPLGGVIGEKDSDTKVDTLADVAWHYYNTDLAPGMTDNVPTSAFDTKSSQHMVNFTVAFGIEGLLVDTDGDGWPNPVLADNSPNWWGNVPVDNNDKPAKVDDMWHAAWNSRGAFYSAKNPVELVDGLTDALSAIEKRAGAAATVSHTTPFITFGTVGFKGGFDSSDWSGWLIASIVTSAGQEGARVWDTLAGSEFSNQVWNQRNIFTYNPVKAGNNKGIPFVWGQLAPAQQTALQLKPGTLVDQGVAMGQARLEFLKGRGVDEAANRDNAWLTANQFRERSTKLGDIVYSEPFYLPGNPGYVFVGANDGMLHAFDAKTGKEVFAYIPSRLFGKLNKLTESPYAHEPYVDGSMAIKKEKVGNRMILVGTLRSGGQSVYALDVTDPASFDENDVLWEFSDTQDSDLGYVFGKPTITQMYDGNWGVLIGNGYNNSEPDGQPGTGRASLYVLKVDDGTVLKKFDTQAGNAVTPNGLAAPAGLDGDLDGKVDFIYAGDLQGKLWKFDVTSNNPAQWNIAFGTAAVPEPLFEATNSNGDPQPITTRPQADAFPPDAFGDSPGYGYLIYFGTGQYIEPNDKITNQGGMQTVYGVWDRYSIETVRNTVGDKDPNDLHPFDRSHLLQQKIIAVSPDPQFPNDPTKGRYVIDNKPIYWHNDLDANNLPKSNPAGNPPTHLGWFVDLDQVIGERVVVDSELRNRKLIVNTTISDATDPCAPGGRSNTLVLDAISGSRLGYSAFDLNKDKKFDQNDLVTITVNGVQMIVPVSSVPSEQGILTRPVIVEDLRTGVAFPCMVGSTGNIECEALAPDLQTFGRQNWRGLITP